MDLLSEAAPQRDLRSPTVAAGSSEATLAPLRIAIQYFRMYQHRTFIGAIERFARDSQLLRRECLTQLMLNRKQLALANRLAVECFPNSIMSSCRVLACHFVAFIDDAVARRVSSLKVSGLSLIHFHNQWPIQIGPVVARWSLGAQLFFPRSNRSI